MVLISLRKKTHREPLGGFTQNRSGSVMTRLMGKKKHVLFFIFDSISSSLILFSFSLFLLSYFAFFSAFSFSSPSLYLSVSRCLNVFLMLFPSHISLSLLFLYLHNGRLRRVPQRLCAGKRGITRIYTPIWVAFNEARYSPALLEAAVFHVFISTSCRMFLGDVPNHSVFCVVIVQSDMV